MPLGDEGLEPALRNYFRCDEKTIPLALPVILLSFSWTSAFTCPKLVLNFSFRSVMFSSYKPRYKNYKKNIYGVIFMKSDEEGVQLR